MANQESESPESGKTSVTLRAVVDRIEDGDIAVLMIDADNTQTQLDISRALLPSETEEGAHLRITIKLDRELRADTTARIRSLREKLLKEK